MSAATASRCIEKREIGDLHANSLVLLAAIRRNPDLVAEAALKIGSANLVVAIDAKRIADPTGGTAKVGAIGVRIEFNRETKGFFVSGVAARRQ